jgi:hypothetical protein
VGPKAGLDSVQNRKISRPCTESHTKSLAVQPVAYTKGANLAPSHLNTLFFYKIIFEDLSLISKKKHTLPFIDRLIFRELICAYSGNETKLAETRCGQNALFGSYSR